MSTCVTCGDTLDPERAELKDYCTKPACFRANYRPLRLVSIGQTKTNAEITVIDDRVAGDLAQGRYRRDPIVVGRQASTAGAPLPAVFAKPKPMTVDKRRVAFVQACQAQGHSVDDIVRRGAYMKLTRSEVVRYMTARRPR